MKVNVIHLNCGAIAHTTAAPADALVQHGKRCKDPRCQPAASHPVAPPAPAPQERRAGQRYQSGSDRVTLRADIGDGGWYVCLPGEVDEGEGYVHDGACCWRSRLWLDNARPISDAPATSEPERAEHVAYTLECGFRVAGDSKAQADCARSGHEANCIECNPMLQPTQYREPHQPAQEAAKAEPRPRCENRDCATPYQNVAQRWCANYTSIGRKLPAELELSCEPCHLLDEKEFAELTPSGGRPYAGPARLPRPRLAHSLGVEDPCLEDA